MATPEKKKAELAELIAVLWRLGGVDDDTIPLGHGILDRALERIRIDLPSRYSNAFSFRTTPSGKICRELPAILARMREARAADMDGLRLQHLRVLLSETQARAGAMLLGFTQEEARRIGSAFREAVRLESATADSG